VDIDPKRSGQKTQPPETGNELAQIGEDTESMKDERQDCDTTSSGGSGGGQSSLKAAPEFPLEKRIGLIEAQMNQVSDDIKSIKQINQDMLQLLMLNAARSSESEAS
jgi:hypothetical protein